MKLSERIESHLKSFFKEVYILDLHGDGYILEAFCIDESFSGQNLLIKSRSIFEKLEKFNEETHGLTVRGFTPLEWLEKRDNFNL